MSDIATAYLRQNVFGIGQGAKYVLVTLANFADANNECFPGIARLAHDLEMDERTIRRHIKKLRELGLLESTSRYRACMDPECTKPEGHAHRTSNYYRLILKPVDLRVTQMEALKAVESPCEEAVLEEKKPIEDNLSAMDKTLENHEKSHIGQNVLYDPIEDNSVHPYRAGVPSMLIGNELSAIESPDQTSLDPATDQGASESSQGRVRSGASRRENFSLTDSEREALASCLPSALQALDAPSAKRVAGLCVERLSAGWAAFEIRRIVDSPLPENVRRLGGLIAARLENYVALDGAPSVLRKHAEEQRRKREVETLALVDDVHEVDPEFEAFWADVSERFPDLSNREKGQMWVRYSRDKQDEIASPSGRGEACA